MVASRMALCPKLDTETRGSFPWLTRDRIMNVYRKRTKESLVQYIPPPPITPEPCIPTVPATTSTTLCKSGGSSKGETEDSKMNLAQAKIATMNEITNLYTESFITQCNKEHVRKGTLQAIIAQVKDRYNLPVGFKVSYGTILKRVKRGKIFAHVHQCLLRKRI